MDPGIAAKSPRISLHQPPITMPAMSALHGTDASIDAVFETHLPLHLSLIHI